MMLDEHRTPRSYWVEAVKPNFSEGLLEQDML
jgi:hypothetical protein